MDQNQRPNPDVEYVEAVPIEPDGREVRSAQPQFTTVTHTSRGCSPCCGPIGCLVVVVAGFYLFAQSDFLRHALLFGLVLLSISTLAGYLAQRR